MNNQQNLAGSSSKSCWAAEQIKMRLQQEVTQTKEDIKTGRN